MTLAPDWDARYAATPGYLFGTAPNAFLASQAHLLSPAMRALAIADGEGRNGVWLAERGIDVHAVDASGVALEKARNLAASRGVTVSFEQVDLLGWEWPENAYDLIVAIFIQFAPPAGRDTIFAGIKRALKPGGLLLLQGYRPEQLGYGTGGPSALENLYTEGLLREAFADLEIVALDSHDTAIEEGCGHRGISALIDLVARRHGQDFTTV